MRRLTIGSPIGLLVLVLAVSLAALASIPGVTPAEAATSCAPIPIGGPTGWAVKAPPPTAVEGATGVIISSQLFVTNGSIGSGGIGSDQAINQIYSLTANSWSAGAGASVLRAELVGVCALHLGTAKVFAIGGRYSGAVLSTVEMYDPVANSWSLRAAMPTARAGLGAATDPTTNTIYVIGGRTAGNPHTGAPLAVNEAYNPVTDTWSTKAPMPTPMMDIYSTVYVNGKIYVIGGFDGTSVSNLVQIYDPVGNSWSAGVPMPTPRSNLIAGVCGGKIYAIGGFDGISNLATNEVYDPVANTWTPGQPSKPTAASEMASAVISTGQDIFAVGSGIRGHSSALNEVFTCAVAVGGISLDPRLPGSSTSDAGLLAGAIAVVMAGASAMGGAAWYVRRRRAR